jgi:hypothetical protein
VNDTSSGGFGRFVKSLAQYGAAIIAIAAVGLAVWEGFENRRHNRLSVVPNIDTVRDFDMRAQTFTFSLLSSGLGPAVVQDVRLYVDDELVFDKNSSHEYAWSAIYPLFRGKGLDIWDSYYDAGQFLLPGERYDLLKVERREGAEPVENFREIADRINVVVCYCSVYGDQCAQEQLRSADIDSGFCPN